MKYIRTKNGVYEVVDFDDKCIIPSMIIKVKNYYGKERITHCCEDDIIKQSDTIEELCDEFVVAFEENNSRVTYLDLEWAIDKAKRYPGHTTIYGAIWTDKGLTYVARMNDKGELKLI